MEIPRATTRPGLFEAQLRISHKLVLEPNHVYNIASHIVVRGGPVTIVGNNATLRASDRLETADAGGDMLFLIATVDQFLLKMWSSIRTKPTGADHRNVIRSRCDYRAAPTFASPAANFWIRRPIRSGLPGRTR